MRQDAVYGVEETCIASCASITMSTLADVDVNTECSIQTWFTTHGYSSRSHHHHRQQQQQLYFRYENSKAHADISEHNTQFTRYKWQRKILAS